MKAEKRGGNDERCILIAMIVDEVVLGRIAAKWDKKQGGLFASKYANLVARWCVDYYQKYSKAPGAYIEHRFDEWSEAGDRDNATVNLIDKLLHNLSGEYEDYERESNSEYVLDVAGRHFQKIKLRRLSEDIQEDVIGGDTEEAELRIATWNNVELGVGAGIDVFQDEEAIKQVFEENQDPLLVYPSALGDFFGGSLERDAFIAILAPEKRGKTFWLLDMAFRAVTQRRKVAFFQVGDLSQNQIMRRFITRVAKRPMGAKSIDYPISLNRDDANEIDLKTKLKEFEEPMNKKLAIEACNRFMKRRVKSEDTYLKLSTHPNSSINVNGIKNIIDSWIRYDWTPDCVIIDYADILAPPKGIKEARDQINETWKQLRSLSQTLHCLVVTATQADAASYRTFVLGRSNFTDDKRKLAHVSGMFCLNQTEEEKQFGRMRLNWIGLRERAYQEGYCVHTAGCLAIANPAIKSCF